MCERTRVFVIGTGVESVLDLRSLSKERIIRTALADAGLTDDRLIQAACVDRAMQTAGADLSVPTFDVVNKTLNGAKTLLLARHLIAHGGIECALAMGIDRDRRRRHLNHRQKQPDRVPSAVDTRGLIRDFDRVQRRFVDTVEQDVVWQQIEQFQENWCTDDVIVACVLASEAFVRRHSLHDRATEIVDMQLVLDDRGRSAATNEPHRLINALGYVGETGDRPAMDTTGLMHCAIVSRALRGSNDAPTAGPHEVSAEILVAQYRRYNAQIQAKL